MRRALFLIAACLMSASVFAETDYRAMQVLQDIREGQDTPNAIQTLRVKGSVILPAGSLETADLADDAVTAAKLGLIAQVYTGTPAIVVTTFTPAFIGQPLIGTVSNTYHVSKGLTTNSWFAP